MRWLSWLILAVAPPGMLAQGASGQCAASGIDGLSRCPSPLPVGRVRVSSGVMAGQRIKGATPRFPPMPKREHLSGATVLHAVIGRDGRVKELTAVSGPEAIRETVMNSVRQWEYKPFILHGEPVEVDTTITLNIDFGG